MQAKSRDILKVCITGTIGSGKSRVITALSTILNSEMVKADEIARQLMDIGSTGYTAFCKQFNGRFIQEDGQLDRLGLRKAISEHTSLKEEVEKILHPLIRQEIKSRKPRSFYDQALILYEIPLIYEVGWQDDFDIILAVYVNYKTGRDRLMIRDGIDKQFADNLLQIQLDSWQKAMMADIVVDNSASFTYTQFQLIQSASYIRKLKSTKTINSVERA